MTLDLILVEKNTLARIISPALRDLREVVTIWTTELDGFAISEKEAQCLIDLLAFWRKRISCLRILL